MLLANDSWGSSSDPLALLVHGAGDSRTTWAKVGPWFAERHWHAVAVDVRGHGESQIGRDGVDHSLSAIAADLVDTVAALRPNAQGVDLLLGHSFGTVISLVCLAEHPRFARRLVLEDPPGGPLDAASLKRHILRNVENARTDPTAYAEFYTAHSNPPVPAEVAQAKVAAFAAVDLAFLSKATESLTEIDIVDLVERCPVPTLVLVGRDKGKAIRVISQEELGGYSSLSGEDRIRFSTALRQGMVVQLETGHDLHESMIEEFAARIEEWLSKGPDYGSGMRTQSAR